MFLITYISYNLVIQNIVDGGATYTKIKNLMDVNTVKFTWREEQ